MMEEKQKAEGGWVPLTETVICLCGETVTFGQSAPEYAPAGRCKKCAAIWFITFNMDTGKKEFTAIVDEETLK